VWCIKPKHSCETLLLLAAAVQRMGDKIMAYAVLRWVTLVCALHLCLCAMSLCSHAVLLRHAVTVSCCSNKCPDGMCVLRSGVHVPDPFHQAAV